MQSPSTPPGLYLRQVLAGQMENFVYAIGCEEKRKALLVDPAWDIDGILGVLDQDGYALDGILLTHYHPDHCGGDLFGHSIEGVAELLAKRPCPVHVQDVEAAGIRQVTGLEPTDLTSHSEGEKIRVGDVDVELMLTPGRHGDLPRTHVRLGPLGHSRGGPAGEPVPGDRHDREVA